LLSEISCLSRLEFGDLAFEGNGPDGKITVGIEIKDVRELIQSAISGRLQTQLRGMLSTYDVSWLALYGIYRSGQSDTLEIFHSSRGWIPYEIEGSNRRIQYSYLKKMLLSITHTCGIEYESLGTKPELILWVKILHEWWSKQWESHKFMRTFDQTTKRSIENKNRNRKQKLIINIVDTSLSPKLIIVSKILSGIPTINYERATGLAKHFKSIENILQCPLEQLALTKVGNSNRKLGIPLAKSILEYLR